MSTYAWVITRDALEDREVSIIGPSTAPESLTISLRDGQGEQFRLRDDDGTTYFIGRILTRPGDEADFEPLDDFGAAYGCTEIQYRVRGVWKTI